MIGGAASSPPTVPAGNSERRAYYAANVADFDGNRLEFVHKAWNPKRR
jgi:hypothetical protein